MAPKGLKIGDTYLEEDFARTFEMKVIGFDGQGYYISECIGEVKEKVVPVEDVVKEELPFTIPDDELVEEQPVVEEVKEKKPAPKKRTTAKRKTATKKK